MSLYPESVSTQNAMRAIEAECDLNVFGAIVAILEGGTIRTRIGQHRAQQIIRLCQDEQQKQLKARDNALGRQP